MGDVKKGKKKELMVEKVNEGDGKLEVKIEGN
jgi:hypothetical protein